MLFFNEENQGGKSLRRRKSKGGTDSFFGLLPFFCMKQGIFREKTWQVGASFLISRQQTHSVGVARNAGDGLLRDGTVCGSSSLKAPATAMPFWRKEITDEGE